MAGNDWELVDLRGDPDFQIREGESGFVSRRVANEMRGRAAYINNIIRAARGGDAAAKNVMDAHFPGWETWPDKKFRVPISRTADLSANASGRSGLGASISLDVGSQYLPANSDALALFAQKLEGANGTFYRSGVNNSVFTVRPEVISDSDLIREAMPSVNTQRLARSTPAIQPSAYQAGASAPSGIAAVQATTGRPSPSADNALASRTGNINLVGARTAQEILSAAADGSDIPTVRSIPLPADSAMGRVKSTLADRQNQYGNDLLERGRRGAYKDKLDKNAVQTNPSNTASPLGLQSKVDTPAHLQIVVDDVLKPVKELSAYEKTQIAYIDCFILRSVRIAHEEKYYVFQALNGETVTYFFGNKPTIYSFSGSLMDSYNQQWYNDFEFFYKNYLRGSAAISNRSRVFMIYKDQVVEGFILNSRLDSQAEYNDIVSFSFDFIFIQKTEINGYKTPVNRMPAPDTPTMTKTATEEHNRNSVAANVGTVVYPNATRWNNLMTGLSTISFEALSAVASATGNLFSGIAAAPASILSSTASAMSAIKIASDTPTEPSMSGSNLRNRVNDIISTPSIRPSTVIKTRG